MMAETIQLSPGKAWCKNGGRKIPQSRRLKSFLPQIFLPATGQGPRGFAVSGWRRACLPKARRRQACCWRAVAGPRAEGRQKKSWQKKMRNRWERNSLGNLTAGKQTNGFPFFATSIFAKWIGGLCPSPNQSSRAGSCDLSAEGLAKVEGATCPPHFS